MADALLHQTLEQHFGFDYFRPGQLDAIRPIMAGRDTLVVMPTGAGKSLCYQLPALLGQGVTLVISPLIALMKDQVDALAARGIAATYINSSVSGSEYHARVEGLARGDFRLVYIAPERLRNRAFRATLHDTRLAMLAVDEAHCVSQWGHDFRPDYLAIGDLLPEIGRPPVIALTATATPRVQDDIVRQLGLEHPVRLVTGFNRPNLHLDVRFAPGETAKQMELLAYLKEVPSESAGIIYVGRRREAEDVADLLQTLGGRRAAYYHGGMGATERSAVQDDFMAGHVPVVVATNAFGMGVDKPDVRFVVHYTIPGTVEAYYQEAGRAGRDGLPSRCLMLYDPYDARLHEWFIENDAPSIEEMRRLYVHLRNLARGRGGVASGSAAEFGQALRFQGETKARVGLKLLEETQLIADLGEAGGRGLWEILPPPGPVDMHGALAGIEAQRALKREQLAEILDYCQSMTCRRQYLLDYFGDATPPVADRCCDNCDSAGALPDLPPAVTEAQKRPLVVLQAVAGLKWGIGRNLLVKLLHGSRGAGMERYFEQAHFGVLSYLRQKQIGALVDDLIREGYLAIEGAERPVLRLSRRGRQAMEEKWAIPLGPRDEAPREACPARAPSGPGDTAEATRELFERGLSVEEIAEHRQLTVGTIYNHLAKLIEHGAIPVEAVVADEVRARVVEAWEASERTFFLSPIKDKLLEEISYSEIRCVLAGMKREL